MQGTAGARRLASGAALVVALALALVLLLVPATAFLLPSSPLPPPPAAAAARAARRAVGAAPTGVLRWAASGGDDVGPQAAPKGFGKKAAAPVAAPAAPGPAAAAAEEEGAAVGPTAQQEGKPSPEDVARLGARQKMAYWEVQKELEREMDLAEIAEFEETQRLLEEGVVGYLPEKISNRMLKRLIPFISMPLLGAGGMFGFYIYLAKNTDIDVPPAFVAFSTQVPFLGALAGITYSIMSTSWDPDVEGSFWGVTEFKANVLNLLESLQKSKREERALAKKKKYERAAGGPNRAKRRELDRLTK